MPCYAYTDSSIQHPISVHIYIYIREKAVSHSIDFFFAFKCKTVFTYNKQTTTGIYVCRYVEREFEWEEHLDRFKKPM